MSGPEQAMLAANMPRLKAQKRLDEGDLSTMHPDDLYDLVMTATGNENLANDYRANAIKATWKRN